MMAIIAKGAKKSNKPKLLGHVDHDIPHGDIPRCGDHRNMYLKERMFAIFFFFSIFDKDKML
jgi:hypothetical protein